MDRRKDGQTDGPYFIGPFWLRLGVQYIRPIIELRFIKRNSRHLHGSKKKKKKKEKLLMILIGLKPFASVLYFLWKKLILKTKDMKYFHRNILTSTKKIKILKTCWLNHYWHMAGHCIHSSFPLWQYFLKQEAPQWTRDIAAISVFCWIYIAI